MRERPATAAAMAPTPMSIGVDMDEEDFEESEDMQREWWSK